MKRVMLAVEGSPGVVDTIVTLLRYIEACGRLGTTRWVELMVDGDGAAQIGLEVDGEVWPLAPAEQAYLLAGEGEGTPALRQQFIEHRADGGGLKIDLA